MKPKIFLFFVLSSFILLPAFAQTERWQQRVEYQMDIDFDVDAHRFKGQQKLRYYNNSPDTLYRVFYHLYFNAFRPGSMMDWQNRNPQTGDQRVGNRIANLKPEEEGWHRIERLSCNGKPTRYEVKETILEVWLPEPILPHSVAVFEMEFQSQVPIQIRRSGRDSRDGVSYSMSQWYPKMVEYDYQGWHPDIYVGREFYGVWGDFDVTIHIDRNYILGASGVLLNPQQVGYGYEKNGMQVQRPAGDKLTWHWRAENVHDFSWSADPDYLHDVVQRENGLVLHFLYQPNPQTKGTWEKMREVMPRAFDFIEQRYGPYPYPTYSFLEAGDGGMEYPMATFLRAGAGVGTFVHELMHAWFYGMLGTHEGKYPWMDEGFTEYATAEVLNWLRKEGLIDGEPVEDPHLSTIEGYVNYARNNVEEPLSTHHDHYLSSRAGSVGAYVKGHVLLSQLEYVMGKPTFDEAMLRYSLQWRFKHPNPDDFFRVMERVSGMELDWFQQYFVFSNKKIDYAVKSVEKANRKQTRITLERIAPFPMPVDLYVTYKNGKTEIINIPLYMMWGTKAAEKPGQPFRVEKPWGWTIPTYELLLDERFRNVAKVEIDASGRLADVDRTNNVWQSGSTDTDNDEED